MSVLFEAAGEEMLSGVDGSVGLYLYVMSQGWPKKEVIRRLDHIVELPSKEAFPEGQELLRRIAK
jgi:hypothetical protein